MNGAMPGKPVIQSISYDDLLEKDKQKALNVVNLIKIKRDGKVKGRTVADGSKECQYLLKEDESVASPTVSLVVIISTLLIDVNEGWDIAIFDVPGAFLQAEIPPREQILLKIKGRFVDLMCSVNPEYTKDVHVEKGTKVLYFRVIRAIYGCISSALLWYACYTEY